MRSPADDETELRSVKDEDRWILKFAAPLRQDAGLGVDGLVADSVEELSIWRALNRWSPEVE